MKSSSFKEVIRLQFNALMMITIKGTLKQKRKLLARRFKQEVLFCEMGEAKLNEQGNVDKYSCDTTTFPVLHFTVQISDEKISTALNKLSEKQIAFILLYYFHDMSDKEIAKLYHVSRSAVGYTRNKGLEKLKMMLSEKEIL